MGLGVQAIKLVIDKSRVNDVADALARDFRKRRRNLPALGGGSAWYVSASGETSAKISCVHVSFEALVQMPAKMFDQHYEMLKQDAEKQDRKKLDDVF